MVPSCSTRIAEQTALVASSSVTTKSRSRSSAPIQRWVDPSWNSSIPGSGRRGRFFRCWPRRGAFVTNPADCRASRVTV